MIPDFHELKPLGLPEEAQIEMPVNTGGIQPIAFVGDWDSVVVQPRQVTFVSPEAGFRIYLTEAQIDALIATRERVRSAPGYERPDVPYFRACTFDSSVLIRRLNGIEQRGRLTLSGQWERV